MSIDIYAADEQHQFAIDLEQWVALANGALVDEGVRGLCEVSLIFTDEVTIASLNQQFMGHDGPTDVLSFPIEGEPDPTGRVPDAGGTGPGRAAGARDSDATGRHRDLSLGRGAQRR